MLGWWSHISAAIWVRLWFRSRVSSASLPLWQPEHPLESKSFTPESEGGNRKFVAR